VHVFRLHSSTERQESLVACEFVTTSSIHTLRHLIKPTSSSIVSAMLPGL